MNQAPDTPRSHPPAAAFGAPPALNWAFLERTVLSTVVSAALVGLMIAVYFSMEVGARYVFFALWSVSFFATTGLIFKYLLFSRSRLRGMLAVAAKLGLLVLVYAVLFGWPIPGSAHERAHMIAMVAGVTTPLVVLVLRAMGWAMDQNKQERARRSAPGAPAPSDRTGPQTGAEFHMHPSRSLRT